jgi:hypothetical protein
MFIRLHTVLLMPPLPLQAAGWIVILCFGALFALLAIVLVWIDVRFSGVVYNSEQVRLACRCRDPYMTP